MRFPKPVCAVAALFAAVPLGSATSPRPIGILLAAGDIAKCDPRAAEDEATAAVVKGVVAEARKRGIPVRVVALGDLAYNSGTPEEFKCFDRSWGAFKAIMLPVPGNHEYDNRANGTAEGYFAYFRTAPLVASKPLVETNGPGTGYYSIGFPDPRRGPWRLIGLNAYLRADAKDWQLQWLKGEAARRGEPCLLAFWHPFVLSSGVHGHRDGGSKTPVINSAMLEEFRVLYDAHASLVLSGHDHNFEQFPPHDSSGRKDVRGVRSFVLGTGGGPLRTNRQGTRWPISEAYDDKTHGVLRIDLYPNRYEWRFLPVAGQSAPNLPTQTQTCNRRR